MVMLIKLAACTVRATASVLIYFPKLGIQVFDDCDDDCKDDHR